MEVSIEMEVVAGMVVMVEDRALMKDPKIELQKKNICKINRLLFTGESGDCD